MCVGYAVKIGICQIYKVSRGRKIPRSPAHLAAHASTNAACLASSAVGAQFAISWRGIDKVTLPVYSIFESETTNSFVFDLVLRLVRGGTVE